MVDPNTRQGKRTPVTLKIKFKSETLEQFIERYAVDVSQGGIFIRTKEPLAVGTQMKFEFQLRDASPLIAGEGTVVWTRDNDPSRPAIAPGMGVRFDRLADGSQGILERILTEKAKQAPQRPAADTSKPPMFTDTPTRVAPTPMQEALLGKEGQRARRTSEEPGNDQVTPLPRPIPFHSDADEFPDEAFEEATKVRALDELIAQTADAAAPAPAPIDDGKRASARHDAVAARPAPAHEPPEAPTLPTPPEPLARPQPRLLDTTPSPRPEPAQPAFVPEALAKTRLGVEPARADTGRRRGSTPPPPAPLPLPVPAPFSDPVLAPPVQRAVAAEQTAPARMPPAKSKSRAPLFILLLLVIAVGGAAVWFFVIRPQQQAARDEVAAPTGSGSAVAPAGSGSAATRVAPAGSGGPGSATAATGSAASAGSAAPKADLVDTVIASAAEGASIEIAGQVGPAPYTAKLEKGKLYRAKITARAFMSAEVDIKGGEAPTPIKLVAKPRVIAVTSEPTGAVILVDGAASGHSTPFDIELTPAQAAKRTVRIQLRKAGFRTVDRAIDPAKLTEEDARMVLQLDEKLAAAAPAAPRPPAGAGSARPPTQEGEGSGAPTGEGSAAPVTPPPPTTPPPTEPAAQPAPPPSAGSAAEPEPDFNKK